MHPADLRDELSVTAVPKVPGLYLAELSPAWSYLHPCGGVLKSIALAAMREALGGGDADGQSLALLSATTVFCQPVQPGKLQIAVTILRQGDSAAQLRASLTNIEQPGPGLEVTATFARPRTGPDVLGIAMPDVPRPEQAQARPGHALDTRASPWAFYRNVEIAIALGEPMWRPGWTKGPAHIAFWMRYLVSPRLASGALDPLALPPLADSMPPALVRALGPHEPRFLAPSLDLTMYFLAAPRSDWILVESRVERAERGYAIGSANLWDEAGQLVARAAQAMTIRALKLPPGTGAAGGERA
jgi:acyl-CoA thioesterase